MRTTWVYLLVMKSLAILGRQPAIALAELESLYGSEIISIAGINGALINISSDDIDFERLGGVMKLSSVLTTLPSNNWQDVEEVLLKLLPDLAGSLDEGKLTLGISSYGFNVNPKRINATALTIKKQLRVSGRSIRIVPNKSSELSSAQVLHNKLFGTHNWEILVMRDRNQTIIAKTSHVQDIDAYAARDQARPKRDARVGMLPPKLAQTLINLCNPIPDSTILDPFCGTGVVLQEAALMNLQPYGTDLEPRMIEYSQKNMDWLKETHRVSRTPHLEVADATDHTWTHPFNYIACETYLGRPFTAEPDIATLRKVMADVDTIHQKFLKNVAKQTKKGFRMCIAVPAWKFGRHFKHLNMLDSLESLGYTRMSFAHADVSDLIYHREGQIVGRELIALERN